MTSVLNVGVMPSNPVGNQIRNLQSQLDLLKKDHQLLLSAIEGKSPEIYAEYLHSKEVVADRDAAARNQTQQAPAPARFQATVPQPRRTGRF